MFVLNDLAALRNKAKSNINDNFSEELIFTPSSFSKIAAEYKKLNPSTKFRVVGSSLRIDNSDDEAKAQTAYLSFQWFNRIHQCRDLIEALNGYAFHLDKLKEAINDDALMRNLPKVDWENTLDPLQSEKIMAFIEKYFQSQTEKELFSKFSRDENKPDESNKETKCKHCK